MKKFLVGLLALIMCLSLFTACTVPNVLTPDDGGVTDPGQTPETPVDPEKPGDETPVDPEKPGDETPVDPEKPGDDGYKFTFYTEAEQEILRTYIGEVIPFIANDGYTFKGITADTDYRHGICFTAFGNTEGEFYAYIDSLSGYSCTATVVDDNGITWYTYELAKIKLEIAYVDGEKSEIRVISNRHRGQGTPTASGITDWFLPPTR